MFSQAFVCPTRGGEEWTTPPSWPGSKVTTPPSPGTMRRRAVRILLECILVLIRSCAEMPTLCHTRKLACVTK